MSSLIRLVDFFEPLKAFIADLKLGQTQEDHLLQLERKFCVICILYKKYEKEFLNAFRTSDLQSGYFQPSRHVNTDMDLTFIRSDHRTV